jgi:NADPH:quinone reductase
MYAITFTTPGGPEVLQWAERPTPEPAADEVLVKIAAAGINRADVLQRQGNYPPPEGASPDIPGMEIAGEITAVGEHVKRWQKGDKVCALIAGGGYAEYAVVPEGQCLPVPKKFSLVEAAALPEGVITVWANLFEAGGLGPAQTALVHGGSSGIGTIAISMVKAYGAKIFVTAGSDEKCAACRKLGADFAINYNTDDFVAVIERETKSRGVDVVLDMVGGGYVVRNLSALTQSGRHVNIAVQGGRLATVDLWLIMRKRLVLTGSTLRHRAKEDKARLVRAVEEKVWPWIAEGKVKPLIYKTFPIKQAAEAHKVMESGSHIGKMVLEVSSASGK